MRCWLRFSMWCQFVNHRAHPTSRRMRRSHEALQTAYRLVACNAKPRFCLRAGWKADSTRLTLAGPRIDGFPQGCRMHAPRSQERGKFRTLRQVHSQFRSLLLDVGMGRACTTAISTWSTPSQRYDDTRMTSTLQSVLHAVLCGSVLSARHNFAFGRTRNTLLGRHPRRMASEALQTCASGQPLAHCGGRYPSWIPEPPAVPQLPHLYSM